MNLLFLCHRIPYPPNKGDKIRSFNEIKHLSKKHDISLVCLVDDRKDLMHIDELKKYCKTIDYDVISPNWQKFKSLAYLFSKKPLSVPYFYSRKLQSAVDYRHSTIKFDAVFAFSSPMAEYVFKSRVIQLTPHPSPLPSGERYGAYPRLIMDFVDVDSDKWRMYSEHSFFPKSLIYKNEWKRLMKYERKVAGIFDISVFVSDAEVGIFKSFMPDAKAIAVPNGVDMAYFKSPHPPFTKVGQGGIVAGERKEFNILFTGAMDYFPNEDGVLYFYNEAWPNIKDKLPQARFYIVGNNPSRRIKNIAKKDKNVIVTGYVSDVRDYFSIADIFIAPLRFARGIQNKVLEALASGLPVIATPQAVQGITIKPQDEGEYLFIEDSAFNFSDRIIQLAGGPLNGNTFQRSQSFLMQNHDWAKNMTRLEKMALTREQ
jgi:sugar transferase (PEP-CTERM/EpsH1 system associated)